MPEDIIAMACNEHFPLSQGLIQFDKGAGLEELKKIWDSLTKQIESLDRS